MIIVKIGLPALVVLGATSLAFRRINQLRKEIYREMLDNPELSVWKIEINELDQGGPRATIQVI